MAAAIVKRPGGRYAGFLLMVAGAVAAGQPPAVSPRAVTVSSTLERIVVSGSDTPGVEIAAGTIASHADQLIVSVRFTNSGNSVVDTVRITAPVPPDVKYVPGSASGPGSEVVFSVDNGRTFGRPAELKLAAADGGTRTADAADYTHIRWVLSAPLDVGATGVARFRAVPR